MRAISKELEQMLEAYSPLVQEGRQIAIGLLDGTVHLEKGRRGEAPIQIRVSLLDQRLNMTVDALFQGL
ncbi:hypothetical protein FH832_003225 [Listeria monocytogenes]|jgi:uncharacterized protein (UPF0262 family)|uniref:hypothetical protein n=1 Tax=Priestia TaxID=2800373 RepID=UPI0006FAABEC|nr:MULTISPECIES: hypothetical protein [Priestia]EGI2115154.1 hypothetical protein [Listeria monocytogenes]KQU24386.1 hypothetical protein ASG61_20960 [Bacillus sp. Leaf75]MCG0050813.1 hypothetical protein [Priestia aryabhattai]QSX24214.1 hypothetical protein J0P05_31325 [Priestia megaterium]